MDTFSMTDMGLLRNSNQDSVFCEENPIGRFPNLFLVADGMGGHKARSRKTRFMVGWSYVLGNIGKIGRASCRERV